MTTNRFVVKQSSTFNGKDLWDWTLRLEPRDGAQLSEIRSVIYGLHPCFPNPNRVVSNAETGFELKMNSKISQNETWGRFDVRVTIALANGKREFEVVPLELSANDSPARELWPLREDDDFDTCKQYFRFLQRKGAYGYAREALSRAAELLNDRAQRGRSPADVAQENLELAQKLALCTYKDSSLPGDTRLSDALKILEQKCRLDLVSCDDPETLGLGGAVHKRLWDAGRVRGHLELALAYYRRGYEHMLKIPDRKGFDAGAFTGINVAHVCELLALEIPPEVAPEERRQRLAEADAVRRRLVRDLPALAKKDDGWWIPATLLDVTFCLACTDPDYKAALDAEALEVQRRDASPWELESTGSQLLRSARLRKQLQPERSADIDALLKSTLAVAFRGAVALHDRAGSLGKLGLALSGGGFRASLFHIGMLARLAELDQLRHVEVISCVSGGSIVGAHYYLLLRKLLQQKPDASIEREDYEQIVIDLLDQFLAGVQKNIRMRVAASLWSNLLMIFRPSHYSRTQRLGELYEKHLYSRVEDGEGDAPRWLNEAFIVPKHKDTGREDSFSPRTENWRRAAKVPMLVLNATTLNTGRNWQFTASYMGEPQSYGTTADATERLDAVYFNEAPEKWQQYPLGAAVAASSCVPSLFTPIVIPGLFKDRTVRLVDGGVHDNQGTRALLDQDCELVIVSDASGQMDSLTNPPHGELGVALRTNSVLQARVRIAQHQELQARVRAGQLRQCGFLHLRKELERDVQSASTRPGAGPVTASSAPGDTTSYGIERRIQAALADLRTDLDSFSDREALSLMYSGYQMAKANLGRPEAPTTRPWRFFAVQDACSGAKTPTRDTETLLRQLETGARLAFKVWYLNRWLNALRVLLLGTLGVGALAGLVYLWRHDVHVPWSIPLGDAARNVLLLLIPIALAVALPVAKAWIARLKPALNPGSVVTKMVTGVVMASVGWLLCGIHLLTFDRLFLRLGAVKPDPTTKP
ncbi:MAG TPA: patatin-like phospholipase family protein [Steroidobacteraceae bacterium]|nr:patatin-like phospholipase family protein [Steroidobacteraceae bacterium]